MALPAFLLPLLFSGGSAAAGALASRSRSPGSFQQVPRFTPQQQAAQATALQQALAGLQNPTAGFEPIEAQQVKRFNEQTIPGLAERFTAMGDGQRSSAFQGALGNAASDLGGQLAALKAQYGLQNQGHLQQLLGLGLQPQFDNFYQQPQDTFASNALFGLSGDLRALSGAYGAEAFDNNAAPQGMPQQYRQQQGFAQPSASQDVASLQSPTPFNPGQGGQANFENYLRQRLQALY